MLTLENRRQLFLQSVLIGRADVKPDVTQEHIALGVLP